MRALIFIDKFSVEFEVKNMAFSPNPQIKHNWKLYFLITARTPCLVLSVPHMRATNNVFPCFFTHLGWVASAFNAFLSFSFFFLVRSYSKLIFGLGTKFSQLVMSLKVSWILFHVFQIIHEVSFFVELHDFSIEYLQNT